MHQARVGLVAAGATICLLAVAYAGVQLAQRLGLEDQIYADRVRTQAATEAYGHVTAGFPRLPTTTDNLRVTMEKYALLTKQTAPPDRLIAEISHALDASPRIELDQIHWQIGTNPKEKLKDAGSPRAPGAGTALPGAAAVVGPVYEIAEIGGRVAVTRAGDVRNITLTVNEFLDALRKRPGIEVVQARMPFEVGSETRLSGDIGTQAAAKAPQFTVTIARKLGS